MSVDDLVGSKQYHYAIVSRVPEDAELRGAIFIKSDTLTNGSEWPDAIEPSFPHAGAGGEGFFWVPRVGDQIEIEIDLADEHPVPKYTRMMYSDEDDIADEFKENYPFRMGWRSREGHIFYFDNKEDALAVKLAHTIGTGFEWDKDGNEIKKVIGDLRETIEKKVIREVKDQVTEMFKAEIKRTMDAKVQETYKKDLIQEIQGALKQTIKKEFKLEATKDINMETMAKMNLKATQDFAVEALKIMLTSQSTLDILATAALTIAGTASTTVGSASGATDVLGSIVNLAGGGLPVALVTSQTIGQGNLGAPVVSLNVQGATKVFGN